MINVVSGGRNLAVAPTEDLRFLHEEHIALGVVDPECRLGINVHRCGLKLMQKALVVANDFEHLLHLLRRWERIAAIAMAGEKFLVVILAEWLAVHHLDLVAVGLAQHFQEDAALLAVDLANADISR